jgi:hypothetical protein
MLYATHLKMLYTEFRVTLPRNLVVGRSPLFRPYFRARPKVLSKNTRITYVCYTPLTGARYARLFIRFHWTDIDRIILNKL